MRLRRVLCASIFSCLLSGGVAEAADVHPEASDVSYAVSSHSLQRPQHPDWYVLPGAATNEAISFSLLGAPAACTSKPPVVVSLYNPEGHWIRVLPANVVPQLRYSGRYLLQVAITDPSCAGAQYSLTATTITHGSGGYDSRKTYCDGLGAQATQDAQRSKNAKRAAAKAKSPLSRTRLMHLSTMLKQMAASEKRAAKNCH